jgi:steroid delta-isomerase-like uncharacterized protein
MVTKAEFVALFDRRIDAFNRHDVDALGADYAEDAVLHSPTAGILVGRSAIERVYRVWMSAFPDARMHKEDLLVAEDRVASIFTFSGTDLGGFLGLPPTGKLVRVRCAFVFTFKDDLIVEERRVLDMSGVLLQLAGEVGPVTDSLRQYRETLARVRLEQELRIAAEIQRALLPSGSYTRGHLDVAATSVPCRAIGGDFLDYFDLPDGTFSFVLGDVAGKGPPAALLSAVLQGIFAAHAGSGLTPAGTLARVNDALLRRAIDSRFATVLHAMLSCDGRLTYCNGGHNPPLLFGPHGFRHRLNTGGLIVGAFKHAMFEEETLQLDPGDTLVVFSDGVSEAQNPNSEEFGEDRLISCVEANRNLPAPHLLECILESVQQFRADATQNDDVTVFILRYMPTPERPIRAPRRRI